MSTIKSSGENLKLSSDNTKDIELQHNGSTKVTVKSDGNVGIASTSPARALEVKDSTDTANIRLQGSVGYCDLSGNGGNGSDFVVFTEGVEKFRVKESGGIRATDGILFGSDTATANALDDYEEGTWTPTAAVGSYTGTVYGNYTKVGRAVHLTCSIQGVTDITSATNFDIGGLPFASGNFEAVGSFLTRYVNPSSLAETGNAAFLAGSDSTIRMYFIAGTSTYSRVQHQHYTSSAVGVRIGITYFTA